MRASTSFWTGCENERLARFVGENPVGTDIGQRRSGAERRDEIRRYLLIFLDFVFLLRTDFRFLLIRELIADMQRVEL